MASSGPADLVVAQLSPPEFAAWSLCRSVGQAGAPPVPVLLVTAFPAGEEVRRISAELGAAGVFCLPGQPEEFEAALRAARSGELPACKPAGEWGLYESMLDGCALHEMIFDAAGRPADYRFLAVNPAFEAITGLAADTVVGRTVREVLPRIEAEWIERYGKVVLSGEPCRFRFSHAGLAKHFEVAAFRPAPGQFVAVFRDITSDLTYQDEIRRLNRLQSVLAQVSQAIVRASSRQELYDAICRVAAEQGQFRLTWIAETGATAGELRLVSEMAQAPGFGHAILASECDINREAIVADHPVVCNHMSAAQSAAACHAFAIEAGIGSCASFPFHCQGKVCGALCLHAMDPGFFNDAEVKLLEEVAADISFALDKFAEDEQRQAAQAAERESEARFATLFQRAPVMLAISALEDGRVFDMNEKFLSRLGRRRDEVVGKTTIELGLITPEIRSRLCAALEAAPHVSGLEIDFPAAGGSVVRSIYSADLITLQGRRWILSAFVDITDRKKLESERETMLRLLSLLNAPNSAMDLIRTATSFLQEWSGCDTTGIRLREGDDFPYYYISGFPGEFVEAENFLCARDPQGNLLRDPSGNPLLECMCGNVLQGRTDAGLPFFTPDGTFWTNGTTDLLAATPQSELQGRTRNRCNRAGYESVALIPLRAAGEVLGLIQLNDKRRGRFTPEMIALLERGASSLAVALGQRRAQAALRDSERRFRAIADYTPDWENWFDPAGRAVYVNPGVEAVTGYSVAECFALPDFPLALIFPADLPLVAASFEDALRGGRGRDIQFRIVRKDGAAKWCSVSYQPLFDAAGQPLGHRSSVRDISDRKVAEEALRLSQQRHQDIYSTAIDGFVVLDGRGRFVEVNDAYCRLTGHTRAEILSLDLAGVEDQLNREEILAHLDRFRETGGARFESRHRGKDGRVVDVEVSIRHIPDRDEFYAFISDITGRKRAQRENDELAEQLRQAQKLESIGRLAGGVAHDFNNLLTVINGYSDLLLARFDENDPRRSSVAQIRRAGERAAELTQQLLAFSRKQVRDPKPLNLTRLVLDNREMLRRILGEDIELVTHLDPALGEILADSGQMHQVLMNLAVNGRDAMAAGGRLIIETANVDPASVTLSVRDTGAGMTEEVCRQIFEPFFTTKAEGAGTGLGLALVHGIVHQYGGEITVQSAPGQGAAFRIVLPRLETASLRAEVRPANGGSLHGFETVLLVEDQSEVRKLAAEVLRGFGYQVLEARDGIEALQVAQAWSGPIHMLLTDVIMPLMNGRDLAGRLHALRPEIRVSCSCPDTRKP